MGPPGPCTAQRGNIVPCEHCGYKKSKTFTQTSFSLFEISCALKIAKDNHFRYGCESVGKGNCINLIRQSAISSQNYRISLLYRLPRQSGYEHAHTSPFELARALSLSWVLCYFPYDTYLATTAFFSLCKDRDKPIIIFVTANSAQLIMATALRHETHTAQQKEALAKVKRPRVDSSQETPSATTGEVAISRGAEGLVSRIPYLGRLAVRKERFPKRYRHPELDARLTSRRIAQEARMLLRLRKAGIRVPAVYMVDLSRNVLIMEYVAGQTLKAFLQQGNRQDGIGEAVMREAGRQVARMHKCDVVHGDLTTGNIMVVNDKGRRDGGAELSAVLIDFGLSAGNATEEDIAVDLYVLERAVISAHSESAQPLNEAFLESYSLELKRPAVLKRLIEVRSRGRKRDMTG